MFQAFYTGLSGMYSFSQNLDTVSNNIANMNTPGYRGTESFYQSLGSNEDNGGGYGTQISGLGYRFSAGDVKQTGNATDLAISGHGMFVLIKGEQLLYTRAGQFEFNNEGVLVDKVSGLNVAQLDSNGKLSKINIDDKKSQAPQATTEVNFEGNISSDQATVLVEEIDVYNKLGEKNTLSVRFTNDFATTVGQWQVEVLDDTNTVIEDSFIRFDTDGTPLNSANTVSFNIQDSLGGTSNIDFKFGESGDFSGSTSVSAGATSSVKVENTDGSGIAQLSSLGFDATGKLILTYSNGETEESSQLALARFTNESALTQVDGSIFTANDISSRSIGFADDGGFGKVVSESIEMSNVDLSKEFADMIIIQRGYQASSKILNVANEMLEQLYESTRG